MLCPPTPAGQPDQAYELDMLAGSLAEMRGFVTAGRWGALHMHAAHVVCLGIMPMGPRPHLTIDTV